MAFDFSAGFVDGLGNHLLDIFRRASHRWVNLTNLSYQRVYSRMKKAA